MKCSAVIFDWDGILVDSQPYQYESYRQVFEKYGYTLTKTSWKDWIANSYSVHDFIEKNNIQLDPDSIKKEKDPIYTRFKLSKVPLKKGAKDLVLYCFKNGYPLGIASHSRLYDIIPMLKRYNLQQYFLHVLSDTDLKRSKPFPDVYLEMAKKLGIPAKECLVIEDSLAGLKAAKSAHMKCIVCPDNFVHHDLDEYSDADYIVLHLKDIQKIIGRG